MKQGTRHRTAARAILLAAVLAIPLANANASNDAGTGGDASDLLASATSILAGTFTGGLSPHDADWYSVSSGGAPACVDAQITPSGTQDVTLDLAGAESRAMDRTASAGATTRLVLATAGLSAARLGTDAQGASPQTYGFGVNVVGVPPASQGDALSGVDAGSSLSSALSTAPGCIGGRLTSVDSTDFYAVSLPGSSRVAYSLAGTGGGVSLRVLDSAGNVVAASDPSAGMGSFTTSSPGTYYLQALPLTFSNPDVGYLLGVIVLDPGSACRPQC